MDGAYTITQKALTVLQPPAGEFKMETEVEIHPELNTQLQGLYVSNGMFST